MLWAELLKLLDIEVPRQIIEKEQPNVFCTLSDLAPSMNAVSGRPNVASPKTGLSAGPLMTSNRKLYPSLNYGFVQMTFVVGRLIFNDAYALWVLFTFAAKMLKVGQSVRTQFQKLKQQNEARV